MIVFTRNPSSGRVSVVVAGCGVNAEVLITEWIRIYCVNGDFHDVVFDQILHVVVK